MNAISSVISIPFEGHLSMVGSIFLSLGLPVANELEHMNVDWRLLSLEYLQLFDKDYYTNFIIMQ